MMMIHRERKRERQIVRQIESETETVRCAQEQCDRVEERLEGGQAGCLDGFSAPRGWLAVPAALFTCLADTTNPVVLAPLFYQPLHKLPGSTSQAENKDK